MPRSRKPKPASELTTDEALARLFSKEAIDLLKRVAHEKDETEESDDPPCKMKYLRFLPLSQVYNLQPRSINCAAF